MEVVPLCLEFEFKRYVPFENVNNFILRKKTMLNYQEELIVRLVEEEVARLTWEELKAICIPNYSIGVEITETLLNLNLEPIQEFVNSIKTDVEDDLELVRVIDKRASEVFKKEIERYKEQMSHFDFNISLF